MCSNNQYTQSESKHFIDCTQVDIKMIKLSTQQTNDQILLA